VSPLLVLAGGSGKLKLHAAEAGGVSGVFGYGGSGKLKLHAAEAGGVSASGVVWR